MTNFEWDSEISWGISWNWESHFLICLAENWVKFPKVVDMAQMSRTEKLHTDLGSMFHEYAWSNHYFAISLHKTTVCDEKLYCWSLTNVNNVFSKNVVLHPDIPFCFRYGGSCMFLYLDLLLHSEFSGVAARCKNAQLRISKILLYCRLKSIFGYIHYSQCCGIDAVPWLLNVRRLKSHWLWS